MKTIALYCGSFNPFHIGHLNIVEKASRIFDKENVFICQGVNPSKENEITSKSTISNNDFLNKNGFVTLNYFKFTHELIFDYVQNNYNVVLIKGLRNGDDLSYENNQISFIKEYVPNLNVLYIPCDKEFEHISSSAIRQMMKCNSGIEKKYIIK